MNKLNTIITSLHEKGIATMTLADDTGCLLGESAKRLFETKTIEDPRSACFYALGVTQQLCRPTIILAKGDHLDHLYTGLVEAWFQQMPLVAVVADVNDQTDYGLYHRCLNKVIDLRGDATVPLDISMQGPTLIITEGACPAPKGFDASRIKALLPSDARVYQPESKYGAISKYMGYLCGTQGDVYCILPLSWLKSDLNIFNNRYLDSRFKLVALADVELDFEIGQWLSSNGIAFKTCEGGNDLSALASSTTPTLYVIKP